MVTDNPVTPGKDSNYINYQRFMSGVSPGAYIRVGGWGTNLTTGTHQWYARALIVYAPNIFAELYILRARFLPLSLRYLKSGPRSKAYSTLYPKTIFVFIGVHSWFAFFLLLTTNGCEIREKHAGLPRRNLTKPGSRTGTFMLTQENEKAWQKKEMTNLSPRPSRHILPPEKTKKIPGAGSGLRRG